MTAIAAERSSSLDFPWWVVLIEGVASLIIGFLLITSPGASVVILVRFLGWYWLIVGLLSFVSIFTKDTDMHWGWLVVRGFLGVLAGIYVLGHPLLSAIFIPTVLVIVMGVQGIIIGVIGLIQSFRGAGWGAGILGLISIIFGVILLGSPMMAATVLPFVFGVFAIFGGIIAIIAAFRIRAA